MVEDLRHPLALPPYCKLAIQGEGWSLMCPCCCGIGGKEEKSSLLKVAASPLSAEPVSFKHKCFNLMIQFSLDAQSNIYFPSLSLRAGTDLL